ncbi:sigma factor-like helix-turn-helix DNA-binding protein [Bacillus sp. SM2101]|uniref:sigma factor-like helix-turn-helix DNA-binding protein n=1 Tax=Bacillus sp. SM2101 TaxID=2805366 RepID=UPI001BDEEAC0|nr:sigma factor-like helix-turn-helix DNA-binding protein [Bacillus sp. SM2101]
MVIALGELKNPILIGFFKQNKTRKLLYEEYLRTEDSSHIRELENNFNEYYFKVRILAYFNKYLQFNAIKYDAKQRKQQQRFQLILDKSIDEENNTILDNIADENSNINIEEIEISVNDFVKNTKLRNAVNTLTIQQKQVLYLYYVDELKDVEIAKKLHVSRQSITKCRNTALNKLRRYFDVRRS